MKVLISKYWWLASIVLFSCSRIEDRSNKDSAPTVEQKLANKAIDSVIHEYVSRYSVNSNDRLIVLDFYSDPTRKYYYITQARRPDVIEKQPDYYFVHEGKFLVLLFTGGNSFFSAPDRAEAIRSTMEHLGISLSESTLEYNPPVWEIIEDCNGKLAFRDESDFVSDFLPCGYRVKQDSVTFDKFYVIKR